MISIPTLSIQSSGFRILNIQDYFDLTTELSPYEKIPHNGGITVVPELKIQDISQGYFYLTQVCTFHELNILTDTDKKYYYSNHGAELKDTELESYCHYHTYKILNNEIADMFDKPQKVEFFDRPFFELLRHWKEVNYKIKFQTWFQYSVGPEPQKGIIPCLSFEWSLAAHAVKEKGNWALIEESFSNEQKIHKTVIRYNDDDLAKIPCALPHIACEVYKFRSKYPELQANYKP